MSRILTTKRITVLCVVAHQSCHQMLAMFWPFKIEKSGDPNTVGFWMVKVTD